MVRIPDAFFAGGFGQRIPRPKDVPVDYSEGAAAVGHAGQNLAGALADNAFQSLHDQGQLELQAAHQRRTEAERLLQEQQAEEKRLARERDKSAATTALVAHENALNEAAVAIRHNPDIKVQDYQTAFDQQASQIKDSFLQQVPEEHRYAFSPTFDSHINSARLKLGELAAAEIKDQARANFTTFLEELERSPKARGDKLAILDESLADTAAWQAAGYGPNDRAKIRQSFAEKTAADEIANRLNTGDPKQIMEDLHATDDSGAFTAYPELDPKTREAYYHTAESRYEEQRAAEERARKERERERKDAARDAFDLFRDAKEGLLPLAVKDEAQLMKAMAGTPYYERARAIQKRTSSIGFVLEKIKQDPLTYGAAQLGLDVPPLDPRTVTDWPAQLQARGKVGAVIQQKNGLSFLPLLTNQEAKGLADLAGQQSPAGVVRMFEQFATLPGMKGATMNQVARQFAATDPTLGMIAGLASNGRGDAALQVATGQRIITEKGIRLDGKSPGALDGRAMQERFAKLAGDALADNPQMKTALGEAVTAAYVAQAARAGRLDTAIDKDLYDKAFAAVVGDTAKINGKRVIIPHGMGEGTFRDFFRNVSGDTVKAAGGVRGYQTTDQAAAAIRSNGQLWEMGEGRYRVTIGNRYLQTDDGRDFVLSLGSHW